MKVKHPWSQLLALVLISAPLASLEAQPRRPPADQAAMRECMQPQRETMRENMPENRQLGTRQGGRMEERFDTADNDDNGYLDVNEFEELLARQSRATLFERLDADADGMLSREELAAGGERRGDAPRVAMRRCMEEQRSTADSAGD